MNAKPGNGIDESQAADRDFERTVDRFWSDGSGDGESGTETVPLTESQRENLADVLGIPIEETVARLPDLPAGIPFGTIQTVAYIKACTQIYLGLIMRMKLLISTY